MYKRTSEGKSNFKKLEKYDLKKDHQEIKKQIKTREIKIDALLKDGDCNRFISEELEAIANEMMAINM